MKHYLITDPNYYSNEANKFREILTSILKKKNVHIACFRDKKSENYKELAKIFVSVCKEFKIEKILLNERYKLAKELGANGVHLNSKQFDKIKKAKELNLYTIISCHSYKDIEEAQNNHVNAITYSPIFESPGKTNIKGFANLRQTIRVYEDLDIIALGGIISEKQVNLISKTRAYGFASIRYFIQ